MEKKTTPLISQGWVRALLFFIILIIANYAVYYFLFRGASDDGEEMFPVFPEITMIMGLIITASFITVVLVFIFCRLIDKIPIMESGLSFSAGGALSGFFLAASLVGTGSMILVFSGVLQWIDWKFDGKVLLTTILLMFFVALSEELAFRGYILRNLLQTFSRRPAIAIAAGAFVFMHAANPGMQVIPVINLLAGGILLGQCYAVKRNIWMPAGFHFAWNFLQGPVLGFRVSGLELASVLDQQLSGREWITGGEFGFEGSVIATMVLVAAIVIMEIRFGKL